MSTNAIALRSGGEASSAARPDHPFGFKAGASVTRTEARAVRIKSAICFASSIGLIASAAPAASPPQIVKWVSGRLGRTKATGRSEATPKVGDDRVGTEHSARRVAVRNMDHFGATICHAFSATFLMLRED